MIVLLYCTRRIVSHSIPGPKEDMSLDGRLPSKHVITWLYAPSYKRMTRMRSQACSRFGSWRIIVNARHLWIATSNTRPYSWHSMDWPSSSLIPSYVILGITRLSSLIISTLPMKRILTGIQGHTHLMGAVLWRMRTSESGTHELVNSVASPSHCPTCIGLPSHLPKWPIIWWPTHRCSLLRHNYSLRRLYRPFVCSVLGLKSKHGVYWRWNKVGVLLWNSSQNLRYSGPRS